MKTHSELMNVAKAIKVDFKRVSDVNGGLSDNDRKKIIDYHLITLNADEAWMVKQKLYHII